MALTPTRPTNLPDYAELCLTALAAQQLGDKISLGGAFALLHYLDYRSTYDVDAWWQQETTMQERQQVIAVLEAVLARYGAVKRRSSVIQQNAYRPNQYAIGTRKNF